MMGSSDRGSLIDEAVRAMGIRTKEVLFEGVFPTPIDESVYVKHYVLEDGAEMICGEARGFRICKIFWPASPLVTSSVLSGVVYAVSHLALAYSGRDPELGMREVDKALYVVIRAPEITPEICRGRGGIYSNGECLMDFELFAEAMFRLGAAAHAEEVARFLLHRPPPSN